MAEANKPEPRKERAKSNKKGKKQEVEEEEQEPQVKELTAFELAFQDAQARARKKGKPRKTRAVPPANRKKS